MPMSDKEVAQWQAQGNRRVRATVDSVGHAPVSVPQMLAGLLALIVTLITGVIGWVLLFSLLAG